MKNYICPKCRGYLSIGNEIIFLTKNKKGDSALVLLSSEIGDYSFRKNDKVDFDAGDHTNFICPICYENLNAEEYDKNLAKVIAIDDDGKESDVVFSKVLGEKCTYSIYKKGIEAFGDHKDNYFEKI
jgi:hypothetical protein